WHGFLPTDSVAPLYRRAHALVVTSRHEAAGVVILEAGASGLPVVGTPVGHLAEWTPDRGVAVASHDPVLLADAIDGLLRDGRRLGREVDENEVHLATGAISRRSDQQVGVPVPNMGTDSGMKAVCEFDDGIATDVVVEHAVGGKGRGVAFGIARVERPVVL